MTNEQILKKAIEKAVKNSSSYLMYLGLVNMEDELDEYVKIICQLESRINGFLFSQEFGKALFGEELLDIGYKSFKENQLKYVWQFHLQQMVLEENPILYLKLFLDD